MRDIRFLLKTRYTASRALIIGIDKYQTAPPLSFAVSDATEIRKILIERIGFEEQEVTCLINEEATREGIFRAYLRFCRNDVDLDERILVFFAGHGHTRTGFRGEIGYLVPYDADPADLATLIRWDELTRNADLIRAKHVMFIMDACYGGLALTRHLQPGSTRFLRDMMLRYSRQVLTAGKADEVVADSGGPLPNHSVFTGHLIEGLQGKAATADGVITASGLMAYVYGKVANDRNSHQTPHYGYFDGDGDFIFQAPDPPEPEDTDTKDIDRLIALPYPEEHPSADTTAAKVDRIKVLLATDSMAIELYDFLVNEVRKYLAATSEDSFHANSQLSREEFLTRLSRYEEATTDIATLLACVAYWARPIHQATLKKILARSADRLHQENGLLVWIALRNYPLLLELYCSGIAAVDGQRFDSLATIFYAPARTSDNESRAQAFVSKTASGLADLYGTNVLKQIPGHERHYVPMSEYLFKTLQPKLDDVLFLGRSYEAAFDTFEVLYALAAADLDILSGGRGWGPIGRFGWKHRHHDNGPFARVVAEGRAERTDWAPLKAGLFGGSFDRFDASATAFTEIISNLRWF